MSNLYEICISLNPSKRAIILFFSVYFLAIGAIFLTEITYVLKLLLIIAIGLQGYFTLTRIILLSHEKAVINIECIDWQNTEWLLTYKNGEKKAMQLVQYLALSSHVVILRFFDELTGRYSCEKKTLTFFIFSDNTTANHFHHLLLLEKISIIPRRNKNAANEGL